MKNKSLLKKGIGILLLLIMSAGVLSGCGKTSSEEEGISVYILSLIHIYKCFIGSIFSDIRTDGSNDSNTGDSCCQIWHARYIDSLLF